jgi:hypothetical protein
MRRGLESGLMILQSALRLWTMANDGALALMHPHNAPSSKPTASQWPQTGKVLSWPDSIKDVSHVTGDVDGA